MKKQNDQKKIDTRRMGSNQASQTNRAGKEGMSVRSNQRGGSNKGGTNDKGSGENPKQNNPPQ